MQTHITGNIITTNDQRCNEKFDTDAQQYYLYVKYNLFRD